MHNSNLHQSRGRSVTGTLLLLLAAFIWGTAFVAQSVGMEHVGPFTFNAVRSLVAAAATGGASFLFMLIQKKRGTYRRMEKQELYLLLLGGLVCGTALCIASSLQQIGIQYTTVGKSGFLTALYIIEVPITGCFLKKRVGLPVWIAVAIATAGMYLLCMSDGLVLAKGDLLVFLCSIAFTGHILAVDYFASRVDPLRLSALQFLVTGLISSVLMGTLETPSVDGILSAAFPILYTALFSSGIAYTLQIVGQKMVQPTLASLVMSLESVFSLLAGAVILTEIPSAREGIGAVLIFLAILLAQIPPRQSANPEQ